MPQIYDMRPMALLSLSDVTRRKFKRSRCLSSGYVLRIILFYILAWKMIQGGFFDGDVYMVTF
jgi:hypothetical protein